MKEVAYMVNYSTTMNEDLFQIIGELEKPEVQESLTSLLRRLPEFEKSINAVSNIAEFGKAVLQDNEALNKYDQLVSSYNVNKDTVNAVLMLIEKLPKLLKTIELLENITDFATSVIQDKQSTEYLLNDAKEYAEPILGKGKEGMAFIRQVQSRAESQSQNISLFTIAKWIKDPAVQKGLNYVQAAIDVLNEKQQMNHS